MDTQAILMAAGIGERLSPLSDKIPKCLVPIGNIPMLWYPLRSLDLSGFRDVLIIVRQQAEAKVKLALDYMQKRVPWKTDGFSFRFHVIPNIEDEGTAATLLKVAKKEMKNLLVVSCDLITDISLKVLLDQHSMHQASVTCMMKRQTKPDGPIPGVKSKHIAKENNIIGIDESDGRLLFIYAEADHEDSIPLTETILQRHPCLSMTSQLEDCHIYCISFSALNGEKCRKFASLQAELIPHVLSQQFEHTTSDKTEEDDDVLCMDLVTKLSSWTDHIGDMDGPYHDSKTRCYVHIADPAQLCLRANTITDYYEANKQIGTYGKHFGLTDFYKVPPGVKRSQAGPDSMIGDEFNLGDKSSIKKSMVGKGCQIGEKVKIINSIIMDNVKIKEGCVIQTSIVCENSTVDEKSELKESIIGAKQTVESGEYKNEILADDDDEFAYE